MNTAPYLLPGERPAGDETRPYPSSPASKFRYHNISARFGGKTIRGRGWTDGPEHAEVPRTQLRAVPYAGNLIEKLAGFLQFVAATVVARRQFLAAPALQHSAKSKRISSVSVSPSHSFAVFAHGREYSGRIGQGVVEE